MFFVGVVVGVLLCMLIGALSAKKLEREKAHECVQPKEVAQATENEEKGGENQ